MVINDENLRRKILDRLRERESQRNAEEMAEKQIAEELEALKMAAEDRRQEDTYQRLVNIGQCFTLLKMPEQALVYFSQAVEEYPDRRFPFFAMVMTLRQLGRFDEANSLAQKMGERFPD